MPSTIPPPNSAPTAAFTSSPPHPPVHPPSTIFYINRLLPNGPCFASCACKSFWPAAPNAAVMCACGHHACYHDHTPSSSFAAPSIPSPSCLQAAASSLSDRLATIEQTLALIRRSPAESIQSRLTALEMAIGNLPDRVEEAEGRLEELEFHSVELENRVDTVERILDEEEEDEDDVGMIHAGVKTPLDTPPPVYREVPSPMMGRTLLPVQSEAPLVIIPAKRRGSAGSEGVETIEVQVGYKRGRMH